jgi:hypothetical protein
MSYLITAKTATETVTYPAVGNRDALMDAAYQAGALGVTIVRLA